MQVSQTQLITLLREGRAPRNARAAIARAALPLRAGPLLEALEILADDPDPAIQTTARASLERLPEPLLLEAASSTTLAPEVLDRLARRFSENGAVARAIAGNGTADDATAAFLATLPHPPVLETIGREPSRLGRSPEIRAALLANPGTPADLARLCRELQGSSALSPPPASGEEAQGEEPAFEAVLVDEVEGEDPGECATTVTEGAVTARQTSICALIKQMSMGQKVALAVKGNRDVRNILIRESNRMLCLKVLENPRLGESDVEGYAKSTNVSEDVLRGIALKKEWCKKYPVVRALVLNPRAPLGVTLDFIKRLNLKDLEHLTKNRNVPETLRSTARKMVEFRRQAKP